MSAKVMKTSSKIIPKLLKFARMRPKGPIEGFYKPKRHIIKATVTVNANPVA